jgi:hypothetical protein
MEDNDNEGLSTGKKVVAGAAIGVAVPAAVGVAKKLMGDSDDQGEGGGDTGRSRQGGRSASRASSSGRSRSSGTKKRTGSTAKSGSRRTTSSGSSSRASGSRSRSGTSRSRSTSSSSRRSSSSSGGGTSRTKEQLYNQAKRLGIEGRSTMTKAQLERAINRARS